MKKTGPCDILFVPVLGTFNSDHIPYAALGMIGYIHEYSDFKADILDLKPEYPNVDFSRETTDRFLDDVVGGIQDAAPKFVGFSSFTTDYNLIMRLAGLIKERVSVTILVGSVHSTLFPGDFIYKDGPVDIAVIGEGENTVIDILRAEKENRPLNGVNGICFHDYEKNSNVTTTPRTLIKNLDILPRFAYEYIDMEAYLKLRLDNLRYFPSSGIALFTGRGCPYICTFCAANTVWDGDVSAKNRRRVRLRPLDNVFNEIKFLKDTYGLRSLYILDDTFTLKKRRVMEFSERIAGMNILWAAETRCGLIDDDVVKGMRHGGCIQLDFGVESGSQRMLDTIEKNQTVEEIEKAFDICHRHGMRTYANILVNIPGETEEDLKMTDDLLRKIKPDELDIGILTPYPGTPIFSRYVGTLEKEDYDLMAHRDAPTEQFRMCEYKKPLQEVQLDMIKKTRRMIPSSLRILTNPLYIRYLKNSPKRLELILFIINSTIVSLFQTVVHLALPDRLKFKIKKVLSDRRLKARKYLHKSANAK